jgi:hypothetical protein
MNGRALITLSCCLLTTVLASCRSTAPAPKDQTTAADYVPCVSRGVPAVAGTSTPGAATLSGAPSPDAASVAGAPVAWTVRETVLVSDDSEAFEPSVTISPDNRRVAFVTKDGRRVLVNDEPLPTFDRGYGPLCFSPDSQRLAYVAGVGGGKLALVVDGMAGKPYDTLGEDGPVFSPDSQRLAYGAREEGKWFVVVDGEEQERYDGFGRSALTFSPDSQRLAYGANVGKQFVMVVDGQRGKLYDSLWPPVFSPDSRRIAYAALGERGVVAVIDGQEQGPFEGFLPDSLSFSPDSQRVAYVVKVPPSSGLSLGLGDPSKMVVVVWKQLEATPPSVRFHLGDPSKWVAVVDGTAGPPYDAVMPPIFSPDGRHVAYIAMRLKSRIGIPPIYDESVVVMDGQEGPPYDGIGGNDSIFEPVNAMMCRPPWPPCTVPSGPIFSVDNHLVYKAFVGRKVMLVVDGVAGRQYDDLAGQPPTISPDGKRVAYVAFVGDKRVVVVDGMESRPYDFIGQGAPIFSPDGARVAYDARIGERMVVVVDGVEWPQNYEATMLGTPLFSPDGRHVLSAVRQGGPTSDMVVVDGQEGTRYDELVPFRGRILFDSVRSFRYLATRGTRWVLVEETID